MSVAETVDHLRTHGYAVLRGAVPLDAVTLMRDTAVEDRERRVAPFELEADTHYPGSPESPDAEGGQTIRRLLWAHCRGPVFSELLHSDALLAPLRAYFGGPVVCPLAHHNCVMTKEPRFSSDTGWHQDVRYWSFGRPDLVSGWVALGPEREENGGLRVVPGSHAMTFGPDRFDEHLFFRDDLPANAELLATAISVDLEAGDLLLFHARTLHAAGRNRTGQTKMAGVFTFRPLDNPPRPGSRSASMGELLLG